MIGVQVGEEERVDLGEGDFELLNALAGTAAAIEYQLLLPGFDQNAWSEATKGGLRGTCTQQGHF
jgi:hypothetical protein